MQSHETMMSSWPGPVRKREQRASEVCGISTSSAEIMTQA